MCNSPAVVIARDKVAQTMSIAESTLSVVAENLSRIISAAHESDIHDQRIARQKLIETFRAYRQRGDTRSVLLLPSRKMEASGMMQRFGTSLISMTGSLTSLKLISL